MSNQIGTLAVSDTGFVFDPRTGNTYAVNTTGLAVLRGLKNGLSLRQIHDDLATGYEEATEVTEHLRQFVHLLVDFGLLPEREVLR